MQLLNQVGQIQVLSSWLSSDPPCFLCNIPYYYKSLFIGQQEEIWIIVERLTLLTFLHNACKDPRLSIARRMTLV